MTNILYALFFIFDLFIIMRCSIMIVHAIPQEKEVEKYKRIIGWGIYLILCYGVTLFQNDILATIVICCSYILIGRLLYYKDKMGILYQFIFLLLLLITEYLAYYMLVSCVYALQINTEILSFLHIILRCVLLLFCTYVLRMIMQKRYTKGEKYLKIRGMIIVPLFSMVLLFMYTISSDIFLFRFGFEWLLLYGILLIIINLYCLYFWYDVAKNGALKQQIKLMQQQNELTLQYYKELEDNYNHSRKIIHDIRNHLYAIEQSAKIENNQYIEDVHAMLNSLGMKFYTENRMLNIVLNDKLKEFSFEQIECRLGGLDLNFVSDMDITTIFANLLDNAFEAQANNEFPTISIKGEQILDFIVVKITNPFSGDYKEGHSSKNGHEGLGLQNVKSALAKYQGELQIEHNDSSFSVTILFPNSNTQS